MKYTITLSTQEKRQEIALEIGLPEEAICPNCWGVMEPEYQNNGFSEPEGPSHVELTGFKCSCGYEE